MDISESEDRKNGLHEYIVTTIGRGIVTGHYRADQPLDVESEISDNLGASRTASREALKILHAKGLIRSKKRAGTFVNPSTEWNFLDPMVLKWCLEDENQRSRSIKDFYGLRLAFEPEAAALAAQNRNTDDIRELRRCLRIMAGYLGQDDRVESDLDFHIAILKSTGNPFFLSFGNLIAVGLKSIFRAGLDVTPEDDDRWIKNHRAVADAIEAADPQRAREAMQFVLNSARIP